MSSLITGDKREGRDQQEHEEPAHLHQAFANITVPKTIGAKARQDEQRSIAAVHREPECRADAQDPECDSGGAEHVQERERRDPRPGEDQDADGDSEGAPSESTIRAPRSPAP